MKKSIVVTGLLVSMVLIGWITIYEPANVKKSLPTEITFSTIEIDMGQLQQGHPQTATFVFQNTGESPLIIQQIETSCGCTEPTWTKHPIKQGHSGVIKVTYDAKHPGRFLKSLSVYCNSAKVIEKLVIKGTVSELSPKNKPVSDIQ